VDDEVDEDKNNAIDGYKDDVVEGDV